MDEMVPESLKHLKFEGVVKVSKESMRIDAMRLISWSREFIEFGDV
jgi:hypothetical protein